MATTSWKSGLALVISIGIAGASAAQGLPGGASSLNETHGDWQVVCAAPEGDARCAMTQIQVDQQSRQRVVAIELAVTDEGDAASGILVLPFGLRLNEGVRLAIDEDTLLSEGRFSTCFPRGCLVPLTFDKATVTALRAGGTLNVEATANGSGQKLAFSISLVGFTGALARIAELNGA